MSSHKHNVDLDSALDWLEANVLFAEVVISETNILDTLIEAGVYWTATKMLDTHPLEV